MSRGPGIALLVGLAAAPSLGAQTTRVTGTIIEVGLHATMTVVPEGRTSAVAGGRFALRSTGSTRLALSIGAGYSEDSATARGEIAAEYLLQPRTTRGPGFYFGGGLGGVVGAGHGGFLLAYAGLEGRPGGTRGWAVEAGLGGGFRIRFAWHWRKFPAGWRAGN